MTDDELWEQVIAEQRWRAEIDGLEAAYARRSPKQWNRSMWYWRAAFAIGIVLLLAAATTDKKREPVPTRIDPCALVLTTNGQECR